MLADWGVNVGTRSYTDSSAAKGIASREGLGKVRHVEVARLWVQEKVRHGDVRLYKVKGPENLSDCLTKYVNGEEIKWQLEETGQEVTKGRHDLAPLAK